MNWGYKITLAIVLFLFAMGYMVYVAMQQTNDMLDDRYYEREKQYQSLIDAQKRLKAVSEERLIAQNDSLVIITLPPSLCNSIENASVHWIRNDDIKKDKLLTFQPDDSCRQIIRKDTFEKGMYKVRIKWEHNNQLYFDENDFFITP